MHGKDLLGRYYPYEYSTSREIQLTTLPILTYRLPSQGYLPYHCMVIGEWMSAVLSVAAAVKIARPAWPAARCLTVLTNRTTGRVLRMYSTISYNRQICVISLLLCIYDMGKLCIRENCVRILASDMERSEVLYSYSYSRVHVHITSTPTTYRLPSTGTYPLPYLTPCPTYSDLLYMYSGGHILHTHANTLSNVLKNKGSLVTG